MNKLQVQTLEFHRAFDLTVKNAPSMKLSQQDLDLRKRLHREELAEWYEEAGWIAEGEHELGDFEQLVKEACDLMYVALGTLVTLGIDAERAFDIVHRSNMEKLWPDGKPHHDYNGKVMKPPTWTRPDLSVLWDPQR